MLDDARGELAILLLDVGDDIAVEPAQEPVAVAVHSERPCLVHAVDVGAPVVGLRVDDAAHPSARRLATRRVALEVPGDGIRERDAPLHEVAAHVHIVGHEPGGVLNEECWRPAAGREEAGNADEPVDRLRSNRCRNRSGAAGAADLLDADGQRPRVVRLDGDEAGREG